MPPPLQKPAVIVEAAPYPEGRSVVIEFSGAQVLYRYKIQQTDGTVEMTEALDLMSVPTALSGLNPLAIQNFLLDVENAAATELGYAVSVVIV